MQLLFRNYYWYWTSSAFPELLSLRSKPGFGQHQIYFRLIPGSMVKYIFSHGNGLSSVAGSRDDERQLPARNPHPLKGESAEEEAEAGGPYDQYAQAKENEGLGHLPIVG